MLVVRLTWYARYDLSPEFTCDVIGFNSLTGKEDGETTAGRWRRDQKALAVLVIKLLVWEWAAGEMKDCLCDKWIWKVCFFLILCLCLASGLLHYLFVFLFWTP